MKKRILLNTFFVLALFLFASCKDFFNPSMDEPVKDYLEYWSSTCQVAEVRYNTPNVEIGGVPNLSALSPIEIDIVCINPKQLNLLKKEDGGIPVNGFSLAGANLEGEGYSYTERAVDPNLIRINAVLTDDSEGETITLSGCLWPENRKDFDEDQLKNLSPELFYTTTFVQNTPPDNVKNMNASKKGDFFPETNMHYLYFEVPNQDLRRNKGCNFEVKYYLLETDGTYYYKGSRILSLDDDKCPGDGTGFTWYFDEQEPYLFYDYTVQVLGPRGLKSETLATSARLGVHQLREPELTITNEPNGLFDEEGFECFEVASDSDSISYTSSVADAGDLLTVTVDGSVVTGTDGVYTLGGIGQHTIVATSSKDGSRPISVVKKIRIVKALSEPKIEFTNASSIDGDTVKFSYLNYEKLLMDITNTYQGDDSTFTSVIDGKSNSGNVSGEELSVGRHKIEISLTKPYCIPIEIEKDIEVKIKPVYVAFENTKFRFHGADEGSGNKFDLRGTLCGETDSTARQILENWNSGRVSKSAFDVTDVDKTFVLQSPTEKFYFYSDGYLYDLDGDDHQNIGKLDKGNTSSTRTLKELKKNKTFTEVGDRTSGGYFNCTFTLVLSEVSYASFSFTPALNGPADSQGYECVEVENSADTVSYKISCLESGVSLSGTVDGSSFSGTKTGTLGLGEHTLFAKCTATGSESSTVTRKIKVVQKLQEPVIKFYKESSHTNEIASTNDNAESGMTYKLYSNYNINLDKDGNGQLYFDVSTESGTTVTVEETTINGDEETITEITSGSLPLGPHILTFTVSKDGNTPVSVEKKVYVQGILGDPTLEFKAKDSSGDYKTVSQDGTDNGNPLYKFSYIYNDTMQICSDAGNNGNSQVIKVDGTQVLSCGSTGSANGWIKPDTTPKITIVQTRQYCKTNTYEKTIAVKIKPITLTFTKLEVKLSGFEANSFNAKGIISLIGNTKDGVIWDHKDDQQSVNQNGWCTPGGNYKSWSDTFTSPTQTVKIKFESFRRHRGGVIEDNPKFGDKIFPGISISSIKEAGWICTWDEASGGGSTKVQPRVTFTASE